MKISRTQSLVVAVGTLLLFFVLVTFLIKGQEAEVAQPVTTEPTSDAASEEAITPGDEAQFVLKEFRRSEIRNGRKVWEIQAARGRYVPETQEADVEDATLWFFQEDGRYVKLTAPRARLALDQAALKEAVIEGGITLVYDDEVSITTERAIFDRLSNTVRAPGKVVINSGPSIIEGNGLRADIESQKFVLEKNIETTINPEGEPHAAKGS